MENSQIALVSIDQLKQIVSEAFNQQGKVYTLKDTCRLLQMSAPTVRKLIRDGKIKGKVIGRRTLVSELAINNFMNDRV